MSYAEKYLNGRHAAHEIEISLNLAYWAACSDADVGSAEYHYGRVLENFKELAAELGYRVEKIEPVEEPLSDLGAKVFAVANAERDRVLSHLGDAVPVLQSAVKGASLS